MKGRLQIFDPNLGHREQEWNTEVEESVSLAEELFNATVADSPVPLYAGATYADGSTKFIDSFDPAAEKILVFPQMSGG